MNQQPASLTATLAETIVASDPQGDVEAMRHARIALVDFLACALGGAQDRSTRILIDTLAGDSTGPAMLIGHERRTDLFTAALVNGHSGHVLDYDDVHASVRGHPTTVVVPALLALASEQPQLRADTLIAAYVVGLETMARLGMALGSRHYENGFHATATLGTIGAAAAIAHALSFSPRQTAVGLGLAATQSAGLRLQFGYEAKPLHAGLAARAGLTAAKLAQAGLSGAADFLDSPIGFFPAFGFGAEAPDRVLNGWGSPWQIVSPGLTLKAFPCCTASHPIAVAGLAFRNEDRVSPDAVERVTITFPHGGDAALVVSRPKVGIDARFSPEYVFAVALTDGVLGIGHFDERPIREDLARLAGRVSRRHDETAPRLSSDPSTRFVVLDVEQRDGTTLTRRVDGLPGITDPSDKFHDATGGVEAFAAVPDLVRDMASAEDLATLLRCLGQGSAARRADSVSAC